MVEPSVDLFWVESVAGVARKGEEKSRSQQPYWSVVRGLPSLPDFLFALFKACETAARLASTGMFAGCGVLFDGALTVGGFTDEEIRNLSSDSGTWQPV